MNGEPSRRTRKVANLIRTELSRILSYEINDPRLKNVGMVTISGIDLASDHRNATVYVSFMGVDIHSSQAKDALRALNRASGFIHYSLKKCVYLRSVPHFIFRYDPSFDEAAKLNKILQSISTS